MFSCYAEQGNILKESAIHEKVRRGLRGPLIVFHLLSNSRRRRTSKCPKALNPERQSRDERRPSRALWESDFTHTRSTPTCCVRFLWLLSLTATQQLNRVHTYCLTGLQFRRLNGSHTQNKGASRAAFLSFSGGPDGKESVHSTG